VKSKGADGSCEPGTSFGIRLQDSHSTYGTLLLEKEVCGWEILRNQQVLKTILKTQYCLWILHHLLPLEGNLSFPTVSTRTSRTSLQNPGMIRSVNCVSPGWVGLWCPSLQVTTAFCNAKTHSCHRWGQCKIVWNIIYMKFIVQWAEKVRFPGTSLWGQLH
jgi:coenzyme F420-reducing hydrogenase gamma subunit